MTYESELENGQKMMALVVIDSKEQVARRYVSPLVNRKAVLSFVVPINGQELDVELVERIRMNQQ